MDKYKGITDYLSFISTNYKLDLCINDFVGFLSVDHQLSLALQPYMIHKNSFCMEIKSNRTLWDRCIRMKHDILNKSRKLKKTYFGMCYCGVEEYIVPILCNDIVIGVICAGEFCQNKKLSSYRISKISKKYDIEKSLLEEKFRQATSENIPDLVTVENLLLIVSEYLANTYATLISTHKNFTAKNVMASSESYILSHILEYVQQNYINTITVGEVAYFCHCSESYINHIFKKNIRVNIKAYINKLRVEQSKEYLMNTSESISEIAMRVGYNDPNYFSNVFTKICGFTPTEYKKRFRNKK
jgi:AraC-like DNA-binding protein/ligand-binding sensor protein